FTDVSFTCLIILLACLFFLFLHVLDHIASPNLSAILNQLILLLFQMIFFHHVCIPPHSHHWTYVLQFASTLSLLLDKHAPLKTITCPSQQRKLFITDDIVKEKAKRSKLETIYRRNKTPANKTNFKNQARFLSKLITASRRSYFRNLISSCSSQPKKLWSALDSLLSRKPPPCLLTFTDPSQLASSFLLW